LDSTLTGQNGNIIALNDDSSAVLAVCRFVKHKKTGQNGHLITPCDIEVECGREFKSKF
jgi:hypothetical protein